MGKGNYTFRDTNLGRQKKGLNPIWRGIGFIILVALTVGGFWLAGYLLEMHWRTPFEFIPFPIPRNFTVQFHPILPVIRGKLLIQLGATVILDILAYAMMVIIYAIINPIRPGKTDAPPTRRRGRGSMVR